MFRRVAKLLIGLLVLALAGALAASEGGEVPGRYHPAYMLVDALPAGYHHDGREAALRTPQGTLEYLLARCREQDWAGASWVLHLEDGQPPPGSEAAGESARRLHSVLLQKGLVDWARLPDRSDGQPLLSFATGNRPAAGEPRRSIRLGVVDGRDHPLPVTLNRIKPPEAAALWLFSAATVASIPELYRPHRPGWLERRLPGWGTSYGWAGIELWEWLALAVILVVAIGCGWLAQWLLRALVRSRLGRLPWFTAIDRQLQWPLTAVAAIGGFFILSNTLLSLTGPVNHRLDLAVLLALIAAIAWSVTRVIHLLTAAFASRLERQVEEEDDPHVRQVLTVLSVVRRLMVFLVVVVTVGVVLQQLDLFRTLGIAMLASAGAAGALIAIAGGPVIGNLIAGLQLAITRPVTIGDTVVIEDRYGWIEEITYTYLVVRTWDQRRQIVPLRHFVSTPFQNLSRRSKLLVRTVGLFVDHRTDVGRVREEYLRLAREHDDFSDDYEPRLLVQAMHREAVELVAYVAADDPSTCWFLHCELRERLIAFVRELEGGDRLPRERVQMLHDDVMPDGAAGAS